MGKNKSQTIVKKIKTRAIIKLNASYIIYTRGGKSAARVPTAAYLMLSNDTRLAPNQIT